jgi:hypothetical protein
LFFFTWLCVGVDAPCSQTLFGYLSLALVYGSVLLYRRQKLLVKFVLPSLLCSCTVHCVCSTVGEIEIRGGGEVLLVAKI